MKIKTEISDTEEIVIRCKEYEKIQKLKKAIETALSYEADLSLFLDGTEYFVPKGEILFFESCEGKVYAHTKDRMYTTQYRLFELEDIMPSAFVRVSKSVIVNISHIESMRREIVGNGALTFRGCGKKTYFSRSYFKTLQYKIEEMRLKK